MRKVMNRHKVQRVSSEPREGICGYISTFPTNEETSSDSYLRKLKNAKDRDCEQNAFSYSAVKINSFS